MRPVLALLVLLVLLAAAVPADTAPAPQWCSVTSAGDTNCTFGSIAACQTAISGTNGRCMPAAPVGHMQPRDTSKPAPKDDKLDALLDRANRQGDSLQLCRGC